MKRPVAFLVFCLGVVISACFAARPAGADAGMGWSRVGAWWSAVGLYFMVGVVLMVVGGVLARRRTSGIMPQGSEREGYAPEGAADGLLEGAAPHPQTVRSARGPAHILSVIADKLDKTEATEDRQRQHELLDEILEADIPDFLEQREALMDRLGLADFAQMIGHFATMERNVARAWSALTDTAFDELPPCLERARIGLTAARDSLKQPAS